MKTAKKISILLAVGLIVGGLAVSLAAFVMMRGDITKMNSMTFTKNTYTVKDNFENIHIEAAEADVRFALSETGECYVDCIEGEKIYHTVEVKDDTLTILRVDNRKWYEYIGVYWGRMEITLHLPQTEYEKLYIRTLSGDIEITDQYRFHDAEVYDTSGNIHFSADVKNELNAKTVSGILTVRGVKPNRITAGSTSGDVTLFSIAAESLSVNATSGNLFLTDVLCGELTTGNTSGDTVLTNVNAGSMKSESVSGEIKLTQCDGKTLKTRTTSGDTVLSDVNAGSMEGSSVSGEIELTQCDAETLKFKTSSGDVFGTLLSDKIFATNTSSGSIHVPNTTTGGICEITTVSGDVRITIATE